MLEVGNGGMTATEYRTHFSLWAIMAAPLLIGSRPAQRLQHAMSILLNTDVIAVDQDPLGKQGVLVTRTGGGLAVYAKPLADGDRAVALFNETGATATISTSAAEIGFGGASSYNLRDLWSKATRTTTGAISASVPSHGTVMYRVSKVGGQTPPPAGTSQLSDLSPTASANGWGPVERDSSNGERPAGDGRTLTIQGTTYAKGLGTHAISEISYYLGGRCSTVQADVGVDDEKGDRGSVVFQIFSGATKVADSGAMTGTMAAKRLTADVSGGTSLRLVVTDAGDGINYDHGDWANPRVTCA